MALSDKAATAPIWQLVLTENELISDAGALALAQAVNKAPAEAFAKLRWLFLDSTSIGDKGVEALANAMVMGFRSIERLALHNCKLTKSALGYLTSAIERGAPVDLVFQSIAGTQAAKQTHHLIPFCHALQLERCKVAITMEGDTAVVRCEAGSHHRTGVEMEALTGATVAALTIYDMCKALTHGLRIEAVRLLEKTGGKADYHAD